MPARDHPLSREEIGRLERLHPGLTFRRFKRVDLLNLQVQDPEAIFVAVPKHGGWAVMVEREVEDDGEA